MFRARERKRPPSRTTGDRVSLISLVLGGFCRVEVLAELDQQAGAAALAGARLVDAIEMRVRENRRIDIQLAVGETTTVVEVTGGATLIETETARISDTKPREVMRNLPLSLRRVWDFVTMSPMVDNNSWQFRLGGSQSNQTDATIDGASLGLVGVNLPGPIMDRSDFIAEMRIDVAQTGAESACDAEAQKEGHLPMNRKRPGRPKGSPNISAKVVVEPSRCPACGSSRRTKYENPVRVDFSGSGLECVAIVYRTCRCLDCGQARRDQEKVYGPRGRNSVAVIAHADVGNRPGPSSVGSDD